VLVFLCVLADRFGQNGGWRLETESSAAAAAAADDDEQLLERTGLCLLVVFFMPYRWHLATPQLGVQTGHNLDPRIPEKTHL